MSKSIPNSAIFMEDLPEDVRRKIKKAFCPPQVIEGNPCAYYIEALVFPKFGCFEVRRAEKNGGLCLCRIVLWPTISVAGPVTFATVDEFRAAYLDGSLHPGDLKTSLAAAVNKMLDPVREHFEVSVCKIILRYS